MVRPLPRAHGYCRVASRLPSCAPPHPRRAAFSRIATSHSHTCPPASALFGAKLPTGFAPTQVLCLMPLFLSVADEAATRRSALAGSRTQPSCGLTARPGATHQGCFSPSAEAGCGPRALGSSPARRRPQLWQLYPLRGRPGPARWRPLQLSPHPAPAQLPPPPSSALPSALPGDSLPRGHSQVTALLGRSPLSFPRPSSPLPPPFTWPLAGPPCRQAPTHLDPPPCPCLSPLPSAWFPP